MRREKYNNILLSVLMIIILLKFFLVLIHNTGFHFLAYGSDAAVYDYYAKSGHGIALSLWMDLLAFLNSIGLYNRLGITIIIQCISIVVLPLLFSIFIFHFTKSRNDSLLSAIFLSLYASIYIYSGDIYRDVVMLFLFFIAIYITYSAIISKSIYNVTWFLLVIIISYVLFGFRPYLGVAFILAYFTSKFKLSEKFKLLLLLYFILILIAYQFGVFTALFEYRKGFELSAAGSTMGIDLQSANIITVIPLFIISYLGQFFGLFITSPLSFLFFIIESIPIIFFLSKINFKLILSDRFFRFLLYFLIAYNSIWVLANDNLGTATRLRMFSYIVICFLYFVSKQAKYNEVPVNLSRNKV